MSKISGVLTGAVPGGVYRFISRAQPATVQAAVQAAGWQFAYLDGQAIVDKAGFLCAVGEALAFPSYYGQNWDAFEECLNDLSWLPAAGYVILYDAVGKFASQQPEEWATARAILQAAAAAWSNEGKPFVVLLRGVGRSAASRAGISRF